MRGSVRPRLGGGTATAPLFTALRTLLLDGRMRVPHRMRFVDVSGSVTRQTILCPVGRRGSESVFVCGAAFRALTGPALAPPSVRPVELGSSSAFPGLVSGTSPEFGRFLT
ncbi:MAG: hypothetical protein RDA78_21770 [Roseibium sp.]|uniref:hypothetical protein n=1 Tax=Roseibium sp. TaxID=1936156 RepID=UPI003D9C2289